MTKKISTQVVVLGAGPGGYTAAFRASDLGKSVVLVEYYEHIGGVCLNVGCIPSKALLHAVKIIEKANGAKKFGIEFSEPKIDLDKFRTWKSGVINKLTSGLKGLAKQRKVEIITGRGSFVSNTELKVEQSNGENVIVEFENAIIAVGSKPVKLPFLPEDKRIITSTEALELEDIPENMLIIGGGAIGLEMGTVYHGLGTKISLVELTPTLLPGTDRDLVEQLYKIYKGRFKDILLETKVTKVQSKKEGLLVTFEGKNAPAKPQYFSKILSSIGRAPCGKLIGAEKAGVNVDERGFISVDTQMRTNVPNIFAIGDVIGHPMLAHKAIPQGKIAAEIISGKDKYHFEPKCIPAVAYTNPEVAVVGVSEEKAKEQGINYEKGIFPWAACGKSLAMDNSIGFTKVIFDKDTNKIIGAGIIGPHAGDLITEASLAIEMGCDSEDLALTVHPHPTLSETLSQACEAFEGTITDLYMPK